MLGFSKSSIDRIIVNGNLFDLIFLFGRRILKNHGASFTAGSVPI